MLSEARLDQIIDKKFQPKKKHLTVKVLKPISTKPIERQYYRELRSITNLLTKLTCEIVIPHLGSILNSAQSLRPKNDLRQDDYAENIEGIIELLKIQFLTEYPDTFIVNLAAKMAQRVESFNTQQINRSFRKIFGEDYSRFEPFITQEMKGFVKANVKLIKSIPEDYFSKLEGMVFRGAQQGKLAKDLTQEIMAQTKSNHNRAALIARGQVAKFNGSLTQLRQQNVGITHYVWSASGDQRVRPEYQMRDGQVLAWADPPAGGHPGMDVNCRCVAVPFN